jgi:hypothetical protein
MALTPEPDPQDDSARELLFRWDKFVARVKSHLHEFHHKPSAFTKDLKAELRVLEEMRERLHALVPPSPDE